MKIIKPSFDIWPRDEQRGGLAIIERAGKTCYKSEPGRTPESAENFVRGLIRRQHLSVLEHGDYIFFLDDYHILEHVASALLCIMHTYGDAPRLTLTQSPDRKRSIVSGNVRAWRELIASGSIAAGYFYHLIDPIYTEGLPVPDCDPDPRVHQMRCADLIGRAERLAHLRQTVRFICDRGISHEFVRHRVMSFSQESTRYCNYSLDRFGREITVIEPCYLAPHTEPYDLWKRSCMSDEAAYFTELNLGLQPQEARAVLPTSTKTELVMTGNLRGWNHFFDLRARQVTGPAHPQAAELALPLLSEMADRFPDVISPPAPTGGD